MLAAEQAVSREVRDCVAAKKTMLALAKVSSEHVAFLEQCDVFALCNDVLFQTCVFLQRSFVGMIHLPRELYFRVPFDASYDASKYYIYSFCLLIYTDPVLPVRLNIL